MMSPNVSTLRRVVFDLLITLGVFALSLGAIVSVARRALFNPDVFADRLAASLADPRVGAFVADRMAVAVIAKEPDLTAFRPLIAATARGAVSSPSFQALVRTAARTAHAGLFSQGGRTVVVSVPVGVLLRSALANANPALAEKIPAKVQGILATLGRGRAEHLVQRLWEVSRRSEWLAGGLGLGGALLAVAAVLFSGSARRALGRLGLDLVVAGLVFFVLGPAGREIVSRLPHEDLARHAAAGLWDAYTGSLRTWAFVLAGTGLVLQAAGRSLVERFEVAQVARRIGAWLADPPGGTRGHLLRGSLLVVVGTFALVRPMAAASGLIMLLGGLLAFVGLRSLFDLVPRSLAGPESGDLSEAATTAGLRAAIVIGMAGLLVGSIAWVGRPHALPPVPRESNACNGAAELCARRLDQVVFPSTHNSMSGADRPDWLFAQQERGIPAQLEDGIRGLLFDVHYGIPVEGRIKTDLDSEFASRDKLEKAVGKEGLDAAMRVRDRLTGKAEGPRGLYLCHGFCELGAIPLADALRSIHEFLVGSPDEVLVLVVEDYVTPQDLAAAFAETGLDGLVYRSPAGSPWPTLREMIDARQRVLVLTESGRPGVDWIHPAFEVMQETPYHFERPSDLSCVANRGGTAGSLFLVNNWIDTTPAPKASNAAIVNAYDALLARSRRCQAERGKLPTVIAVDFYRTGDLFRVARTLNGLSDAAPAPD
jgi:hypothetical protein